MVGFQGTVKHTSTYLLLATVLLPILWSITSTAGVGECPVSSHTETRPHHGAVIGLRKQSLSVNVLLVYRELQNQEKLEEGLI